MSATYDRFPGAGMNRRLIEKAAYGALAGTLLTYAVLFWRDRALIAKGYPDFTIFYSAGSMVRQGLGHELYENSTQYRIQRTFASGVVTRQGNLPYNHLPFEALIFAPLSYMPYGLAYAVWDLLNLAMLAAVPALLRPHIAVLRQKPLLFWWLLLLAFPPVFAALHQGQDVVLLLILQVLAFTALKRREDVLAGFWFGLGSFKYHLIFPLVLVIALGWRRTRILLGFLATCLALEFVSVAIVGWKEAASYPKYVLHLERVMDRDAMVPDLMPNLRGLLVGWSLPPLVLTLLQAVALVLSVALFLWAIVISRRYTARKNPDQKPDQKMDLFFALATVTGLLIGYHTSAYDLILLAVPLFSVLDLTRSDGFHWKRDLALVVPPALLMLAPLYFLLSIRLVQTNLLALVLLAWFYGIQRTIKAEIGPRPAGAGSTSGAMLR